jgi:ankyrin repeat protein
MSASKIEFENILFEIFEYGSRKGEGYEFNVMARSKIYPNCSNVDNFRYYLMDWLLNQGMNPNIQNDDGRTPLYMAVAQCYPAKFFERLFKAGADPNIPDNGGATPIFCCNNRDIDIFLSHGANINHQNYKGNTALHEMIKMGDHDFAQCLIQRGADITIRNKDGLTPNDLILQHYHKGWLDNRIVKESITS